MPYRLTDLTGRRFGRLIVLNRHTENKRGKPVWVCKCDCGNITCVPGSYLTRGNTKSCGCFRRDYSSVTHKTHGMSKNNRLYRIWNGMKDRCLNPSGKYWKRYGERGISVCNEWKDNFTAFRDWALSNGYEDSLTLDRIDNNQGYSPANCRWATYKTQENNRSNNILYRIDGNIVTLAQLVQMENTTRVAAAKQHEGERIYGKRNNDYKAEVL